ncbi:ATPase [Methylobacterium sp. Leaf399]|uniref:ATP12 family chaperone protein n=1 Tax=Methylobacterium sp. Leaf399 TaxID=1736364 RepID=UPI0006F3E015|nr:ATP12 family protein [Methylobacterium sp. Leaf399]KQT11741.1 ATPase [Methylobacterium sp. Leaf399]
MNDDTLSDWLGEPDPSSARDPLKAVREGGRPALPKRFYEQAGFADAGGGFRLTLDGRSANTPAKNPLTLPTRALAEAVAAEWQTQVAVIDPARMPLTRLANTAIDGVAPRREAVVADLAAYAVTDLVAYRAGEPERLVAMQAAAWDPVLDWAYEALGARFILSEGVRHVDQPERSIRILEEAIAATEGPFRLAALHTMTTLTGSLLIALAVLRGRLSPEEAWEAAHVDETYQAAVWGPDEEAQARMTMRKAEFEAAALTAQYAG